MCKVGLVVGGKREEVGKSHQITSDGREEDGYGDDARFVSLAREVSDEHDETDVSDVVEAEQYPGLLTTQAEPIVCGATRDIQLYIFHLTEYLNICFCSFIVAK